MKQGTRELLLRMSGISKAYAGVCVVNDASLEVNQGETVALVGENGAGKSTLMKILLGMTTADDGITEWRGEPVAMKHPSQALARGISMIHQEISLVPGLSVSENIWLGRERSFSKLGFLGRRSRLAATRRLLDRLGYQLDPEATVSSLSIAQMQLVEIARAISYESALIIMDEPTSALTPTEVALLYRTIASLNARGVAVIFISHKLQEVFAVSDKIVVMRDGRSLGTFAPADIDTHGLVTLIAGRELAALTRGAGNPCTGDVVLEVEGLSGAAFADVSLSVRAGEILGLCGLMGSGRTEIVRAIYGLDRRAGGLVRLGGSRFAPRSTRDSVNAGLGMVTEDRLRSGAIFSFSILQNSTLAVVKSFRRVLLRRRREVDAFSDVAGRLQVKAVSPRAPIGALSGGNQQKIILSRWMYRQPRLLILDEPTRGIDVGGKAEIYRLMRQVADSGIAILLVSSEVDELLALADRIVVIRHGRLVHEQSARNARPEDLLAHAFGVAAK